MSFSTISQSQLGQETARNSEIVTSSVKIINSGGTGPTITSVIITDSNYNNLDDTAVGTSNSFIKIIGSGFSTNANVFVGGTQVPTANVIFTDSGELRVRLPFLTVGTNNSVSLFNTTGSGVVWSSSLFCSGFPVFTTTSYSSNSLTVSVQLLATGDGTLTYTLKSGSSLPEGLTLSSTGLISGTATVDSTTTFTVLLNDSQNQTTQQDITLTISSTDLYFKYTTLLLQADNTANGAQNGTFLDSSNNRYIVTPSGTKQSGTINPFGTGNWSNYFDGTGDYLTVAANTGINLSSDFTVECWAYATTTTNGVDQVFNYGNFTFMLYHNGTDWTVEVGNGSSNLFTLAGTASLNNWHHFAITRNTNTYTFWIDGVSASTATNSNQPATSGATLSIGRSQGSSTQWFTGYISNFRIVKGTSLYTTTFTPSTTPLTAVVNTQLLTCQSNFFKDSSTNVFTVTTAGNLTVDRFNPFGVNGTSYDVSANTFNIGSTYFDGSSYLQTPASSDFAFGTGDFTVEGWVYSTAATSGNFGFFDLGTANAGGSLALFHNSGSFFIRIDTTANDLSYTVPAGFPNAWHHLALVRNGVTLTFYIDGVSVVSGTRGQNVTQNQPVIGSINPSYGIKTTGYISNFRMVKGTAVYTGNFTPSGSPLTAITNTKLLTCQSSQSIESDISINNFQITYTGTPTASGKVPFGLSDITDSSTANTTYSGSIFFNGSTDYLSLPTSTANLNPGSSDFTVDGWLYPTVGSSQQNIVYLGGNTGSYAGIRWEMNGGGTGLQILASTDGSSWGLNYTAGSLTLNAWNHVALCRSGSSWYMFINGVQAGSTQTLAGTMYSGTLNQIGAQNSGGTLQFFNGYMSNMRFIKGTALYTAAFTPPTSPSQPVTNTQMLISGKNSAIFDGTLQNNWQTYGDAKVSKSTYKYGTGSIYLPSLSALIKPLGQNNKILANEDFTIECWFNVAAFNVNVGTIYSCQNTEYLAIRNAQIEWQSPTASLAYNIPSATAGQWYHLAISRSGSSIKMFLNGTQVTSTTSTAAVISVGSTFYIGAYAGNYAGGYTFNGYLDDFRITKGYARYTANFTVPPLLLAR